jgi:hypothetical protein
MARITPPQWDPYDVLIECVSRLDEVEKAQVAIINKLNRLDAMLEKMVANHSTLATNHQKLVNYVTETHPPRK